MDTCENEPAQANSPYSAHVSIEEVVEQLGFVVDLHHGIDGEDAERHHGKRQDPHNCCVQLK